MTTFGVKSIVVSYQEPDGSKGIVNFFSADNAEVSGDPRRADALRNKAVAAAGKWSEIFPNTRFLVEERVVTPRDYIASPVS